VRNWGKSGSKFRTCNVDQRPFEHRSSKSEDVVQEKKRLLCNIRGRLSISAAQVGTWCKKKRGSCATWAGVLEAVAMTGEGAPLLNIGAGVEVGAGDEARVTS